MLKRPYVDEYLQKMGELFECVLFTASLAKVSASTKSAKLMKLIFLDFMYEYIYIYI